jgi:hypothetical protein
MNERGSQKRLVPPTPDRHATAAATAGITTTAPISSPTNKKRRLSTSSGTNRSAKKTPVGGRVTMKTLSDVFTFTPSSSSSTAKTLCAPHGPLTVPAAHKQGGVTYPTISPINPSSVLSAKNKTSPAMTASLSTSSTTGNHKPHNTGGGIAFAKSLLKSDTKL